ncbi:Ig-like domain-containing protein, partial [Aquabacterium sp. A7-Y]|uniref:Ig-like domain-containing protein n=1 Tax=Aquabacterium sp. A7-Y TaxID=1349605 RepID=UPI00223E0A98
TGPVSNGQASDDSTLLLSGSCEAGATVLVYDGSMLLGTATVNGTSWSYSATVTDATQHQFRATATDAAGNTSAPTADIVVVGDMTAPTTHLSNLALSDDTGVSSSDFITSVATQTLSASLSAALGTNEKVMGSLNGGATWSDLTGMVSGTTLTWSGIVLTGEQTLQLAVVDATGSTGPVASHVYRLDTAAPTPQLTSVTDDAGLHTGSLTSGDATDDTAVLLSGSCEPGSTVEVYDGSDLLGTATVSGTSWTYTATVVNGGLHQFYVTETDAAGHTSTFSDTFTV